MIENLPGWQRQAGYEDIEVWRENADRGRLSIGLARPERRNAMSGAMVDSLLRLLDHHDAATAGAIILYGVGRGFCAGSDLDELATMNVDGRASFEAGCGRLALAMAAYPRPIIAAVHGFAIGGGLTLAATCDIVIGAPGARWTLPEVPIGLFPAWGLGALASRLGCSRARQLSWGIDTLDGNRAAAWGLVDDLAENPLAAALDRAGKLALLPQEQAAMVKAFFAMHRTGEDADDQARVLFLKACATQEAASTLGGRLSPA